MVLPELPNYGWLINSAKDVLAPCILIGEAVRLWQARRRTDDSETVTTYRRIEERREEHWTVRRRD
jgi:hypothetical protein